MEIQTAPRQTCLLCGSEGEFICLQPPDRLFGASGLWDLKQCLKRECGLVWLGPMPLKEDIGNAYASYYAHAARDSAKQFGVRKKIRALMERGYWANEYIRPLIRPAESERMQHGPGRQSAPWRES